MSHFNITRVNEGLNTKYLGRSIVYNHVTKTTMDDAENGAREKGDADGTVYIADRQTGARGSKGRTWKADSTGNLYFTFIIFREKIKGVDPDVDRRTEFFLGIASALATLQTLEKFGVQGGRIKWLNDIWVKGHKLFGVLTEYKGKLLATSGEKLLYLIGIGLNINCDMKHDPHMYRIATSTMNEIGSMLSREDVFANICNHLEPLLTTPRETLYKQFEQYALFKSGDVVSVTWLISGQEKVYKFQNVTEDWTVDLRDVETGDVFTDVSNADISVRPKPDKEVFILSDSSLESWSHDLLLKLCFALVDTAEFNVKSVTFDHIKKGVPLFCKLIIIGELKSSSIDQTMVSELNGYVNQGGACLCVGNGYLIFQTPTIDAPVKERKDAEVVTVTLVGSNILLNLCSVHDTMPPSHTANIGEVLAVRKHDKVVDQKASPEVFVSSYGEGKLAVCLPNIEAYYVDIEDNFPLLSNKITDMLSTSFQQDCLFKNILQCLGV